MKFESLGFLERWYSERMIEEVPLLRRLFEDIPDASCRKKNGKGYFLELEISKKTLSDYDTRIKKYLEVLENPEIKESNVEGAIFLCTDPSVLNILREKSKGLSQISVLPISRYLKDLQ